MTENDQELLNEYERRIKKGFPVGEVKSELLNKGYSEDQANDFINEIDKNSTQKNAERNMGFSMILSALLIIFGIYQVSTGAKFGIWFIISGSIKLVYDIFFNKKKEF